MNYHEASEFLLALPDMERSDRGAAARPMSLEAMFSLLARLQNPELGPKTAHLTGSKGKGSTSAFLAAMLSQSESTSLYTSPHLHSMRERICFNLRPVTADDFAAGVAAIKDVVLAEHKGELGPISTFGALTALFFYLSSAHRVQWQVVEVGMGGLYDASNVFAEKELVIITPISLEHTKILGKTTLEIAENKAGIIRPGAIVVLAPQKDEAVTELIRRLCLEQGAGFINVAAEYKIVPESFDTRSQIFSLLSKNRKRSFSLRMLGLHQIENATTAIAAIDALNGRSISVSDDQISEALMDILVPGRLEILSDSPTVVVDGAHNGESALALVAGLKRHFDTKSAVVVLGLNSDKSIKDILKVIKPICRKLIATRSSSEKAMDPAIILAAATEWGIDCQVCSSVHASLELAMQLADHDELICATGSFYLVAEVREYSLGVEPTYALMRQQES